MTKLKSLDASKINSTSFSRKPSFSSQFIHYLTNLETLKLCYNSEVVCPEFALKKFIHLKKFTDLYPLADGDCHFFDDMYGENFEALDQLKIVTMNPPNFLNFEEFQRKYPHVRFRYVFEEQFKSQSATCKILGYYEGSLISQSSVDLVGNSIVLNTYHGKGTKKYKNGVRLEGHFDSGSFDNGVLTLPNGQKYEGKWKGQLEKILMYYLFHNDLFT